MSTNAASTPTSAPAAQAAPSADAVLSDMAARRLALAADVDELAARLAPHNLAKVAKLKAREKVQDLRSQVVSKAEDTVGQVKNRLASLGIVTVAGLALAGLSVTATVAAVKAFRARAARA